jgi:hypothetical protein
MALRAGMACVADGLGPRWPSFLEIGWARSWPCGAGASGPGAASAPGLRRDLPAGGAFERHGRHGSDIECRPVALYEPPPPAGIAPPGGSLAHLRHLGHVLQRRADAA